MVFSLIIAIAAVAAAIVVFALLFRRKRLFPGPAPAAVIGNILQIDPKKLHKQLEQWAEEYGEIFELWFIGRRAVAISDVELARKILFARPDEFRRPEIIRKALEGVGAVGLFGLEGEVWKRHRRLVTPAFSKASVNRMHHCITIPVERMLKKWQSRVESSGKDGFVIMADPRVEMSHLTLDVITYLACGFDLNAVESGDTKLTQHLAAFFNSLNERIVSDPATMLRRLIPGWDRDFKQSRVVVVKLIEDMIETTKKQIADEQAGRCDASARSNLLREMILASMNDETLTDDELVHEVLTIMLAGLDTTSILLSWSIAMLCKHPEYHQKIRDEIIQVCGETALPTPDQISKLKITGYFLQETLRVHGPAPFNSAENVAPFEIRPGVTVEPGTVLFILSKTIMNKIVTDAAVFKPERWEDPKMTDNLASSFAFTLPFGGGTRVCPGRQLALIEATEALSVLVRAFNFEFDGPEPEGFDNFVVMTTPYNVKVRMAPQ